MLSSSDSLTPNSPATETKTVRAALYSTAHRRSAGPKQQLLRPFRKWDNKLEYAYWTPIAIKPNRWFEHTTPKPSGDTPPKTPGDPSQELPSIGAVKNFTHYMKRPELANQDPGYPNSSKFLSNDWSPETSAILINKAIAKRCEMEKERRIRKSEEQIKRPQKALEPVLVEERTISVKDSPKKPLTFLEEIQRDAQLTKKKQAVQSKDSEKKAPILLESALIGGKDQMPSYASAWVTLTPSSKVSVFDEYTLKNNGLPTPTTPFILNIPVKKLKVEVEPKRSTVIERPVISEKTLGLKSVEGKKAQKFVDVAVLIPGVPQTAVLKHNAPAIPKWYAWALNSHDLKFIPSHWAGVVSMNVALLQEITQARASKRIPNHVITHSNPPSSSSAPFPPSSSTAAKRVAGEKEAYRSSPHGSIVRGDHGDVVMNARGRVSGSSLEKKPHRRDDSQSRERHNAEVAYAHYVEREKKRKPEEGTSEAKGFEKKAESPSMKKRRLHELDLRVDNLKEMIFQAEIEPNEKKRLFNKLQEAISIKKSDTDHLGWFSGLLARTRILSEIQRLVDDALIADWTRLVQQMNALRKEVEGTLAGLCGRMEYMIQQKISNLYLENEMVKKASATRTAIQIEMDLKEKAEDLVWTFESLASSAKKTKEAFRISENLLPFKKIREVLPATWSSCMSGNLEFRLGPHVEMEDALKFINEAFREFANL